MAGSFIDTAKDFAADNLGLSPSLLDKLTGTTSSNPSNSLESLFLTEGFFPNKAKGLWQIDGQNWHKVFSYRFVVKQKSKGNVKLMSFALPIPPQQLMIKPILPTLATPTLGGVVEEISPVKFWMIDMAGTTGTGVGRDSDEKVNREKQSSKFREVMETTGLLAGAVAGANQTIAKVGGVADDLISGGTAAASAFSSGNPLAGVGALAGGITGAINTALLPPLPYAGSAVSGTRNGFTEAHELLRFFYFYQAIKAKSPKEFELWFVNFKTDQSWRVVVKDLNLQRNAANPNLERYKITLKGWDVQSPKVSLGLDPKDAEFDRFGPEGNLKPVNVLNPLDVAGKAFSNIKSLKSAFTASPGSMGSGGSLVK